MNKFIKYLGILLFWVMFMSEASAKAVVVYYSATGTTKLAALKIALLHNADVFEIKPKKAYTTADLDYRDHNSRVCRENKDMSIRDNTLLQSTPANFSEYDEVFIGYPIWWDTYAWPVDGFLGTNDFTGKKVYPFCTSGGDSIDGSIDTIKANYPDLKLMEGLRIKSSTSEDEIKAWINQ